MPHYTAQRTRSSAAEKESKRNQLRQGLTCDIVKKQKSAIREILCDMSKGDDYSAFYVDVIKMMSTSDMELKKLLCLFLVSQAPEHHEKAHFLVNTLQQDCKSADPLTRALAVKTMGGIRCSSVISNFISELINRVSTDDDPYVRKCAVLCVAKFYATDSQLVEASGLISHTEKCLNDSNPMVICNTIIALTEMSQMAGRSFFPKATSELIRKLCTLMIETTEWGKVVILDFFATLDIASLQDAERIIEDIQKCLQNTNSAVVLSAIKVTVIICMKFDQLKEKCLPKIVSNLVGLLHSGPEMLYLILRNINLIVQEFPDLLTNDVNSFITSSNEPHCVRMEKIEIMTRLVTPSNIETVLAELNTYAQEADSDIIKKAIISIGKCAVKVPEKASTCVTTILGFIEKDPINTVEAAIIVMKDIFRQYPGEFPIVVKSFVENINSIQDSDAKAALVWFLGEYPDSFEDLASDFQAFFLEDFLHEPHEVQLQILTAAVKIYLCDPTANKSMLEGLMNKINDQCQNPDIRDRSFMYWRLISSCEPVTVKKIVCAKNPRLDYQTDGLDSNLRRELIKQMCTLASVYHKSPHTFIGELDGVSSSSSNVPRYEASSMSDAFDVSQEPIGQEEFFDDSVSTSRSDPRSGGYPTIDFNQFSHNFASATDDINSGFSLLNLGGSNSFGMSNLSSQPSSVPIQQPESFGHEFGATSSTINFNPASPFGHTSSFTDSTRAYQPLPSSPQDSMFGSVTGSVTTNSGFQTSSDWKTGANPGNYNSLTFAMTGNTDSQPFSSVPFADTMSSSFGIPQTSYSSPLEAHSSFGSSGFAGDVRAHSDPSIMNVDVNPVSFSQQTSSSISLNASFVKKDDSHMHLSVRIMWRQSGLLKNVSLFLRPNFLSLSFPSSGFGSIGSASFSCGDIPSQIEKEFIVPVNIAHSIGYSISTSETNSPLNVIFVDCFYGKNESTSTSITVPLRCLVSENNQIQQWESVQSSIGTKINPCNLTASHDSARMILSNNGFRQLVSVSHDTLKFGAILLNDVAVGVEIKIGMPNSYLLYSSNPSLIQPLLRTLAIL